MIVFTPDRNHRRHDYTGAFKPEGDSFAKMRGAKIVRVNQSWPKSKRRKQVLEALEGNRESIAFFSHGLRGSLPSMGFGVQHVNDLARACAHVEAIRIVLYACLAGRDDDGFAASLRDALCVAGARFCQIDAHTTAGHTTRNPYVKRFFGEGSGYGGSGGGWIIAPGTAQWGGWRRALATDLRFRFPFMPIADIHEEVAR